MVSFLHAKVYYLFILLFSQRTICALKTFLKIEGQQAYSRKKKKTTSIIFLFAQVMIVRVFFIFKSIVLFSSAL